MVENGLISHNSDIFFNGKTYRSTAAKSWYDFHSAIKGIVRVQDIDDFVESILKEQASSNKNFTFTLVYMTHSSPNATFWNLIKDLVNRYHRDISLGDFNIDALDCSYSL